MNLSERSVALSAAKAGCGLRQDTSGGVSSSTAPRRQPAMRTDLLVKLRISLILQGGLPVAGGTPCDFLEWLCASPSPPLSSFWTTLHRAHWHETMVSGKTHRLTCAGGFKG